MSEPTPDGAIFLAALATIAPCLLIYIILQAIRGKGIVVLPYGLLFGCDGAAWIPGIILIGKSKT